MSVVKGKEGKNLPPTIGTLIPHVFRAFYSALVSKLAITLLLEIPPPTDYYWVRLFDIQKLFRLRIRISNLSEKDMANST